MRKGLLLLAALALPVAGAGCSSDDPEPAPAPKPVQHTKAPIPRDRDARAVSAALTRLDACALIDPEGAGSRLFPATTRPVATGPHTCELTNTSFDELIVSIGEPSADRFDERQLVLAGSKAYQSQFGCTLDVPVSFTAAIVLRVMPHGTDNSQCDETLQKFGTVTARALRKPAATARPLSGWDACTVLHDILGAEARELSASEFDGIDGCHTSEPNQPQTTLRLRYDPEPTAMGRPDTTIGGRKVRVYDSTDCQYAWSQGASGVTEKPRQVIELSTATCNRAGRRLAAMAMRILAKPAPKPSVRPQQPLTYRSDEPDAAAAGACVDFRDDLDSACEPYHPVQVPHGTTAVLRAAQADPNVQCAVAVDAVGRYFGTTMHPVVIVRPAGEPAQICVFIQPEHAVVVEVWLWDLSSGDPSINATDHHATIAPREGSTDPYLISAPLKGGELRMQVHYLHPRGARNAETPTSAEKPPPLAEFTAAIVNRYFHAR